MTAPGSFPVFSESWRPFSCRHICTNPRRSHAEEPRRPGLQPIAPYAGGAWEINQDHIAAVHKGETVMPAQYAEPWRQHAAGGRGSAGGIAITFQAGAVPVTIGDLASMGQVRSEMKRAISETFGTVVSGALARTGAADGDR